MRTSSPGTGTRRDEAVALDEVLDRVEELGGGYGDELLATIAPWIDRAREAANSHATPAELRRMRLEIERALLAAAYREADGLMVEHGEEIDGLISRAGLVGHRAPELAAVVIDPRSPDVPTSLRGRAMISIELRSTLARELSECAPATGSALSIAPSDLEHDVVVWTFGRILRTRRHVPAYGTT
jgi:hypothetical protein